jgi:nucleoside-diphosphate-sugar epimerase
MRIFVTGATGFIGAHFIEKALDDGHSIVGLYRSEAPKQLELLDALRARGAVLHRGDLSDPTSIEAAIAGAECVCHFAAAFRESGADEAFFEKMNNEGTATVLKAARAAGVKRFVHCSTAGIHGQRVPGLIDEKTAIKPWNGYERSKVAAEEQVRQIAGESGMEYVILRPTAVYGPRDERLQKLYRSVAKGRFPLFGKGEGRRHLVYVSDLADAFLRACTVPEAANQAFIIAGPEAVPLRQLLMTLAQVCERRSFGPQLPLKPMMWVAGLTEDICRKLKVAPPIYRRRMDFYLNDAAFSSSRAQAVLGWMPKVGLKEGLTTTVRATLPEGGTEVSTKSKDAIRAATQVTARQLRGVAIIVIGGLIAVASALDFA